MSLGSSSCCYVSSGVELCVSAAMEEWGQQESSFLQGGSECAGSADMSDSLQLIGEIASVLEHACCSPCSQLG